jgi:hypothetical protein
MSYFAKINSNNIVTDITVAEQEFINTGRLGEPSTWVETTIDGSIRKQYATIGDAYDAVNDVFIKSKPFPSWTLDDNFDWQAPTAHPDDFDITGVNGKIYDWNEVTKAWDEYGPIPD